MFSLLFGWLNVWGFDLGGMGCSAKSFGAIKAENWGPESAELPSVLGPD